MSFVNDKYYHEIPELGTWNALSFWDRFKHRHKRKMGMAPLLIIHQGIYVIKGWSVPVTPSKDNEGRLWCEWGVLHSPTPRHRSPA